jgi:hypothetical protein
MQNTHIISKTQFLTYFSFLNKFNLNYLPKTYLQTKVSNYSYLINDFTITNPTNNKQYYISILIKNSTHLLKQTKTYILFNNNLIPLTKFNKQIFYTLLNNN